MMRRSTGRRSAAAGLMAASVMAGCVSDQPAASESSQATAKAQAAESVTPTGVILVAPSAFADTDGDNQPDSASVLVYATGRVPPRGEVLPIKAHGQWVFKMMGTGAQDGRPLATWEYSAQECAERQVNTGPGPGWAFTVRLPEEAMAIARSGLSEGLLWAEFRPESPTGQGSAVLRSRRGELMVFGSTRPVGGRGTEPNRASEPTGTPVVR
jgi:hypothetical protein